MPSARAISFEEWCISTIRRQTRCFSVSRSNRLSSITAKFNPNRGGGTIEVRFCRCPKGLERPAPRLFAGWRLESARSLLVSRRAPSNGPASAGSASREQLRSLLELECQLEQGEPCHPVAHGIAEATVIPCLFEQ